MFQIDRLTQVMDRQGSVHSGVKAQTDGRQSQVLGRQGSVHGGDLIRHRQTAGRVRYLAGRVRCTGNQDTGTGTGTGTGDRRKPAGTTWETHKTNWHRTNITPLTKYPTNEQTRHTWRGRGQTKQVNTHTDVTVLNFREWP